MVDWKAKTRPVERMEDGWMPSFESADGEGLRAFLDEHGFVVVNLLSMREVEATTASFWAMCAAEARRKGKTAPLSDDARWDCLFSRILRKFFFCSALIRTWEDGNWPAKGKFLFAEDAATQEAFNNRTHPKLYEVFRAIFQKDVLLSKVDKWGAMRGTVHDASVFPETGGVREDWKWELLPHWDCNPHEYNEELKAGLPRMYQGLIALRDCFDDPATGTTTGGFRCVPGSAKLLDAWCQANPSARASAADKWSHYPPKQDPLYCRLQKIPLRAGQCVIWVSAGG